MIHSKIGFFAFRRIFSFHYLGVPPRNISNSLLARGRAFATRSFLSHSAKKVLR
jgi:hypothetical protein